MSPPRKLRRQVYTVAWLCALAWSEQVAAIKMLDEQHEDLPQPDGDDNTYTYGSIKGHNIIIACLPLGQPGTISASILVGSLPRSFPNLRIHLVVGVGGGIPHDPPSADPDKDIRLGDVVGVAEKPGVTGVVQYDFERDHGGGNRELLGVLDKPDRRLLTALGKLFSLYALGTSNFNVHLERLKGLKLDFTRPTRYTDRLYSSSYEHLDTGPKSMDCDSCLAEGLILRRERLESDALIHQGQILSGDSVIKNTPRRDELSRRFPNARCFEMEAAGVMDQTHCLVIRGISDYADSHKNQHWQPYAAGTAAAFAREFLLTIQPHAVIEIDPIAFSQTGPPPPKPSPSSTVPFRRDPDFVDRDVLADVDEKCSKPASRAALVGLGGVGKSQLAIEYSYRVREKSPQTWVFWIYASNATRFEEGYRMIAERIKLPRRDEPTVNILRLVSDWLCDEANGQWVMILDNADDPTIFFNTCEGGQKADADNSDCAPASLATFLPQTQNGSILVTSRSRDAAFRLTGNDRDIIGVEPMKERHALKLFTKKFQGEFDEGDARGLLQALDYMPLAISQAAAYIKQRAPRITVKTYLENFQGSESNKALLLDTDVGDLRRDPSAVHSISMTWTISFEYIRQYRPSATRLLSLMSLFDRQGIPASLLRHHYEDDDSELDFDFDDGLKVHASLSKKFIACFRAIRRLKPGNQSLQGRVVGDRNETEHDEMDFRDDVHTLKGYSLIGTTDVAGELFEMHRLVQLSTRKWLDSHGESERWKTKYVVNMSKVFPVGKYENWTTCQALFPHAQALLAYRPTNRKYVPCWAAVLHNAAWYTWTKGDYLMAERLNRQMLESREKVLGLEHPDILNGINNLALVLHDQGKYEESEEMNRRAVKGKEKVLGVDHPDTLVTVINLALVLRHQGKYQESEEMNRRALKERERVLGLEHPDTLTSISNLALMLRAQGKYQESEEMNRRALKGSEKVLGLEHPDTLTSINNLALVLREQGRYKESEEMNRQALKGTEKVLGVDHPDTLITVDNLAYLFHIQKRYDDASVLYLRASTGFSKTLGPDHPDTKICSRRYADMISEMEGQGSDVRYSRPESWFWFCPRIRWVSNFIDDTGTH